MIRVSTESFSDATETFNSKLSIEAQNFLKEHHEFADLISAFESEMDVTPNTLLADNEYLCQSMIDCADLLYKTKTDFDDFEQGGLMSVKDISQKCSYFYYCVEDSTLHLIFEITLIGTGIIAARIDRGSYSEWRETGVWGHIEEEETTATASVEVDCLIPASAATDISTTEVNPLDKAEWSY